MSLPNDYARCADGQHGCPRADTCARMLPADVPLMDVPLISLVDFWVASRFMGDDECGHYIQRDAQRT